MKIYSLHEGKVFFERGFAPITPPNNALEQCFPSPIKGEGREFLKGFSSFLAPFLNNYKKENPGGALPLFDYPLNQRGNSNS